MNGRIIFLILSLCWTSMAMGTDVIPPNDSVYITVDQKPIFPGCDTGERLADIEVCSQGTLLRWVSNKTQYPETAIEANIEGVAVMSFVINQDGSIDEIKVLKDPGGGLGEEALRILHIMKAEILWKPAFNKGEAVKFRYVLPIKFRLGPPTQDMYLVFKAWGGQEVFRGMVDVSIQDAIPDKLIKNIETYDFRKSKAVYEVIGNVHIVHFRPKNLSRPHELSSLKPVELGKIGLEGLNIRYIKNLDQLNISLPNVKQRLTYYVHNYIGDIIHQGRLGRTNGHIEKVNVSKAAKGVLFLSFATGKEYATALAIKE